MVSAFCLLSAFRGLQEGVLSLKTAGLVTKNTTITGGFWFNDVNPPHTHTHTPYRPKNVIIAPRRSEVPVSLLRVSPTASATAANTSQVPGHKVASPGCRSQQIYALTPPSG